MIIRGELSANFKTRKRFACSDFVKGCNILNDYTGHRVKCINSNSDYRRTASVVIESVTKTKSIEIDLQKDEQDIIVSVLITVVGENINEDYLNNAITLCKSAFKIDEVLI